MSKREVATHFPYSVKQCADDILAAETLEPKTRGAKIAAAKKRLKAHITLNWLLEVAYKLDLDMTPGLAANIVKGWLGRCISRNLLKKTFSLANRTAGDKSVDAIKSSEIIDRYREKVLRDIGASIVEVESLVMCE